MAEVSLLLKIKQSQTPKPNPSGLYFFLSNFSYLKQECQPQHCHTSIATRGSEDFSLPVLGTCPIVGASKLLRNMHVEKYALTAEGAQASSLYQASDFQVAEPSWNKLCPRFVVLLVAMATFRPMPEAGGLSAFAKRLLGTTPFRGSDLEILKSPGQCGEKLVNTVSDKNHPFVLLEAWA